ncbi:MAG: hypothetical protein AB1486_07980 [Planctomycetota bacterium]
MREDLQQDKRSALLAVARMFDDFRVPYAVTGGVALQLYSSEIRYTVDLDVVTSRREFEPIREAQPWDRYGLELVLDRRRYMKLRHPASNVDIDLNLDTRFLPLLEGITVEHVEGMPVRFVSLTNLAVAKLRTQRSDWPRTEEKRLQDRVDLMRLLRANPHVAEAARSHPLTNDEMRRILDDILALLRKPSSDDLPPEDGADGDA